MIKYIKKVRFYIFKKKICSNFNERLEHSILKGYKVMLDNNNKLQLFADEGMQRIDGKLCPTGYRRFISEYNFATSCNNVNEWFDKTIEEQTYELRWQRERTLY